MTDDPVPALASLMAEPCLCAVTDALAAGGARAWAVGGAVRDVLLGSSPGDVDLATDAPPEEVTRLAEAAGLHPVPTGISHGTVTVVSGGRGFEVTTLRRDVATDGRHAEVAWGADLAEDAARRDFTMNALYADPEGRLIDPLGGLPDLRARKVRFVGDARARIREDRLRSLRYFRMQAWHGDPEEGLDADALDAVAREVEGLDQLSRERVTAEILRLLAAPDPAPATAAMARTGALGRVLPGAGAALLAPLVHVEELLGLRPEPLRRLTALGGETDDLRLSRKEATALARLREGLEGSEGPGALGQSLGEAAALSVVALRAALFGQPPDTAAAEAARAGARAVFPLGAADLAPLAGAPLGERLRELRAAWAASGFRLGREELLARSPAQNPG
jgi:poly(A) polymerase